MTSTNKVNPDLDKERKTASIDINSMKLFLGELMYFSLENYNEIQIYSKNNLNKIFKPSILMAFF